MTTVSEGSPPQPISELDETVEIPAVLQARPAEVLTAPHDSPRHLQGRTVDDVMSLYGSVLASLGFVWVVYEHVLLWSGQLGFLLSWWACFLVMYAAVSMMSNPRPIVLDRVSSVVVKSGAAVVIFAVASTIIYTFYEGWPALHHLTFYTQNMAHAAPGDPLSKGGVRHAVLGSGIEVAIATAIALPLGISTAVYMTEVGGWLARVVRTVVEAMTALPDVLAGLFIYALLILGLGWDRTGFAVSLALAVTMVPTVARSAEVVLRVVPSGLREASLALGASKWQTVRRVVLPTSKSGLATALILGIARIAGETAPLLIVSRDTNFTNGNPLHDPMNSLPLFIYSAVRSPQPLAIQRGYGAAALLLSLVLILFILTRFLARDKNGSRK